MHSFRDLLYSHSAIFNTGLMKSENWYKRTTVRRATIFQVEKMSQKHEKK